MHEHTTMIRALTVFILAVTCALPAAAQETKPSFWLGGGLSYSPQEARPSIGPEFTATLRMVHGGLTTTYRTAGSSGLLLIGARYYLTTPDSAGPFVGAAAGFYQTDGGHNESVTALEAGITPVLYRRFAALTLHARLERHHVNGTAGYVAAGVLGLHLRGF